MSLRVPILLRRRPLATLLAASAALFVVVQLAAALIHYQLGPNLSRAVKQHPWLLPHVKAKLRDLEVQPYEPTFQRWVIRPLHTVYWSAFHGAELFGNPDAVGASYLNQIRSDYARNPEAPSANVAGVLRHIRLQNQLIELCDAWKNKPDLPACRDLSNKLSIFWNAWLETHPASKEFHYSYYLTTATGGAVTLNEKPTYLIEICNYTPYPIVSQVTGQLFTNKGIAIDDQYAARPQEAISPGACKDGFSGKDFPGWKAYLAVWPQNSGNFRYLHSHDWHRSTWGDSVGWAPEGNGPIVCSTWEKGGQFSLADNCGNSRYLRPQGPVTFNQSNHYVFYVVDHGICEHREDENCKRWISDAAGGIASIAKDLSIALAVRRSVSPDASNKQTPYLLGYQFPKSKTEFERGMRVEQTVAHPFGVEHAVQAGDRLISIAGMPVFSFADVKVALSVFGQQKGLLVPVSIEFERHGQVYEAHAGLFFNPEYWGKECPNQLSAMFSGLSDALFLGSKFDVVVYCVAKTDTSKGAESQAAVESCKRETIEHRWRLRQFCGVSYSVGEFAGLLETAAGAFVIKGIAKAAGKSTVAGLARGALFRGVINGLEEVVYAYNSTPPGRSRVMTMPQALSAAGIGGAIGILMNSSRTPVRRR